MTSRRLLRLFMLAIGLAFALPAWAEQKPLTQDQVQSLVRSGLGDATGAKAIEQRGIDFAPAGDFLQSLKAAGANEAFLEALRRAKPPAPASAQKPLDQVQIILLLAGQVPGHRVSTLVRERGIDFEPADDYLKQVRLGGGDDELVSSLKSAKVRKPTTVDPALQARQALIRQHVGRGAELAKKGQYAASEKECRTALLLDSENAGLYVTLGLLLHKQKKWDDAESAEREAVRLDPKNELAHHNLGFVLADKGDSDGAIAEESEALRLDPNNELAHANLGLLLQEEG